MVAASEVGDRLNSWDVAHALVRAVSRLISTPMPTVDKLLELSVGTSADVARTSACATTTREILLNRAREGRN